MESFRSFSSQSQSNGSPAASAQRTQLEHLWKTPAAKRTATESMPVDSWLTRVGRWLYLSLTDTQQVRVWTKKTRHGVVWCAYDPKCDRAITCPSEDALRIWLEQRHLN